MDKEKYQIKSTPFMRRLVSKSKKNGELQRLKDEYERIKCLNDRMMQVRMRQMRLKRLYRVIEIIKNSPQNNTYPKQKTNDELRAQQILRARQLGQEFSRQNALELEQNSNSRTNNRSENSLLTTLNQTRSRILKRIQYGNKRSRINLEEMSVQQKPKPPVIWKQTETNKKRELLQQRINYGNNCSHSNLVQSQRACLQVKEHENSICRLNWLDSVNAACESEQFLSSSMGAHKDREESLPTADVKTENSGNNEPDESDSTLRIKANSSLDLLGKLGQVKLEDIVDTDTELKSICEATNLHKKTNSSIIPSSYAITDEKFIKLQHYNQQMSKNDDYLQTKGIGYDMNSIFKTFSQKPESKQTSKDNDEYTKSNAVQAMCRIFEH